jgi:ribosomal protein S18 acetylase RimI-like enzyme
MSDGVAQVHFVVRHATAADVGAIVALVESAYRGDISRLGWTTEADFLDGRRVDTAGVAEIVGKRDSIVLLAESDDATLLACCHIEKQGVACYFGMFSVRPGMQGSGIGRRMLAEAENVGRTMWKSEKVEMTVISIRTELITWYERRGYHRTGRFKPFPYGDERFGIPKRDDLQFELMEKAL